MIRFPMALAILAVLLTLVVLGDVFLRGRHRHPRSPTFALPGDPDRGRTALVQYGCGACHVIPGIRNANGRVGPQLHGLANQMYVGGHVANTPENLSAWIQNPQRFAPGTAMPNLNVPESAANDMAAYLFARTERRR